MNLPTSSDETRLGILSLAHRSFITLSGLLFLIASIYWSIYPGDDPYRCRALFETGRWIDPPDENGDRLPFAQWQPDGCLLNNYTSEDIRQCMDGRHIVFSGDSTVRQIAYGVGRILQRNESKQHEQDMPRRVLLRLQYHGLNITYVPNPYLHLGGKWEPYHQLPIGQSPYSSNLTVFTEELDMFMQENDSPVSIEDQTGAALVVIGGGPWFAAGDSDNSREIWKQRYIQSITNVSDYLGSKDDDIFTAPFDSRDGRGNQLVFIPPSGPCLLSNSSIESGASVSKAEDIIGYQNWLNDTAEDLNFNLAWALPATVAGQNKTFIDPLFTGWHYIERVAEERANILLNFRCNAKLDRIKKHPTRGNCCTDYGSKPLVQRILVSVGMGFLVVCIAVEMFNIATCRTQSYLPLFNMEEGGALVLPLLMAYHADRTQIMAKGGKVWDFNDFTALCAPMLIIGLFTIWKSPMLSLKSEPDSAETEHGFLSDYQMDEWRGWMIIIFAISHWVNIDESIPLHIITEVLMSSFLFISGYEHTTYFLVKRDFSIARGARVMLRFNLLTCFLCHFTNNNYLHYTLISLVNFFFLMVWATMAFDYNQLNDDTQLVITKICISVTIVTCIVKFTPTFEWAFEFLPAILNIHWDVELWKYHLEKELYITYIGMLVAVANHASKENISPILRYVLALIGAFILKTFWTASSQEQLTFGVYVSWHNLVSHGPILSYLALRNVSATFRNFHSKVLARLGQSYLELYVLHMHIFLAADGRGVLLTGVFAGDGSLLGDRWRDVAIIAPIFIWISLCAAIGTQNVVNLLITPSPLQIEDEPCIPLDIYDGSEEKNNEEDQDSGREADFDNLPHAPDSGSLKNSPIVSIVEYMKQLPSSKEFISFLPGFYFVISLLLFILWTLNLLTPPRPSTIIPDGNTTAYHD